MIVKVDVTTSLEFPTDGPDVEFVQLYVNGSNINALNLQDYITQSSALPIVVRALKTLLEGLPDAP